MADTVLSCGKYSGATYDELFTQELGYCEFIVSNYLNRGGKLGDFAAYIDATMSDLGGKNKLSFGMHRNETYEDVYTNDASYCDYLMKAYNEGILKNSSPKLFCRWIKSQPLRPAEDKPKRYIKPQ